MQEPLKQLSHEQRKLIKSYRKKQKDIAPIINGYDISNEDLSSSYISDLNLSNRTIENVNFTGTRMKLQFQKGVAKNCVFILTHFLQESSLRSADIRNCSFRDMKSEDLDYAYADFRGCDLCGVVVPWFSKKCHGAKFDRNFLKLLSRFLDIEGLEKYDNV